MTFETLLYATEARSPRSRSTARTGSTRSSRRCPTNSKRPSRRATADPTVKVIVLRGAGRSFCAGYDFGDGFHHWDEMLTTDGAVGPG